MILERLIRILEDYSLVNSMPITLDTTFDDFEMDSLDEIDVITNIEEEFNINIEVLDSITSIRGLIELIENKQEENE